MSGEIVFAQGDLIEYTRPVKGEPNHDRPITVRGVVIGFAIGRNDQTGELVTRVWIYEGAHQLGKTEKVDPGVTVTEGRIDKEQELVIWKVRDLLDFDNFRFVRRGNHPTDMGNFDMGKVEQ